MVDTGADATASGVRDDRYDRYAEAHVQGLKDNVSQQQGTEAAVGALLQQLLANAVTEWSDGTDVQFSLRRFGSRAYGVALPRSDLDLVCELVLPGEWLRDVDEAFCDWDITAQFLAIVLSRLEGEKRCGSINDAIQGKATISFSFDGQLPVDLTAHIGPQAHTPSEMTAFVRSTLDELPYVVRHLASLVVDFTKKRDVCVDRGAVGRRLKGIHWILLVIAWWRAHPGDADNGRNLFNSMRRFLLFFGAFSFESAVIDPAGPTPILSRDRVAIHRHVGVVWMRSPLRDHSLLERVDEEEVNRVQEVLRAAVTELDACPPGALPTFLLRDRRAPAKLDTPDIAFFRADGCEQGFILAVFCQDKSMTIFQQARDLCTNALRGRTVQEAKLHDTTLSNAVAACWDGAVSDSCVVLTVASTSPGQPRIQTLGVGWSSEKRMRAAYLALAVTLSARPLSQHNPALQYLSLAASQTFSAMTQAVRRNFPEDGGRWMCPSCDETNRAERTRCNGCLRPRPPLWVS